MKTTILSLLVASGALTVPGLAQAAEPPAPSSDPAEPSSGDEAAPEEEPQGPKMHLAMPEPVQHVPRSDYVHNGFYFRAGVGPGFMSTTLRNKDLDSSASRTGFSLGSSLLVGGSPAPGMVFGGGALTDLGFSAGGEGTPGLHVLAGPFFDAFPNSKGGWHLGTMLGFGVLATDGQSLLGGGAAAWAGHDIWVAPEWSTGFHLRAAGTHMADANVGATNFSLHLMITVLSH